MKIIATTKVFSEHLIGSSHFPIFSKPIIELQEVNKLGKIVAYSVDIFCNLGIEFEQVNELGKIFAYSVDIFA